MNAYLFILTILFALELLYIRVAERFGVVDNPNSRSSHRQSTVRGGGIVFVFSSVIYFLWSGGSYPWFLAGMAIIAAVSFADDLRGAPIWFRLVGQFAGSALIMHGMGLFVGPMWLWCGIAIACVAFVNAYNFMDGINGSAGLYTFVTLATLAVLNERIGFVDSRFIYVAGLGCAVFCFFNVRNNPRCFAGDVGSLSMGTIILFALLNLIVTQGNMAWLVLVSVYGTDAGLTIVRRMLLRENILKPHRMHVYQILCNECGHDHIAVASSYAGVQLAINVGAVFLPVNLYVYFAAVVAVLSVVYGFILKNQAKL